MAERRLLKSERGGEKAKSQPKMLIKPPSFPPADTQPADVSQSHKERHQRTDYYSRRTLLYEFLSPLGHSLSFGIHGRPDWPNEVKPNEVSQAVSDVALMPLQA